VSKGHFLGYTTVGKIIQARYYWPTMFKEAFVKSQNYQECQRFIGKKRKLALPLEPIQGEEPFQQWALVQIKVINPNSSFDHKFIITTIDYFTRWVEVELIKEANQRIILKFIEKLITRYAIPQTIIFDNSLAFVGADVTNLAMKYGIYWKTYLNYYPQGNGLAESTNKNLLRILKRILEDNPRTWHEKLNWALWADRITFKSAMKTSPYTLVYGKRVTLPTHIELPILRILQ